VNLIAFAPLWLAGLLLVALLAAAAEDLWRLRISNVTVLAVIATAIAAMAFEGFRGPLWQNAVIFAVIMIIGTFAFSANLLGGGDVKLLAAAGLWVNFETALWLIASIFIAGGAVAVIYIIRRKLKGVKRRDANRIPYGIAIASGAIFVLGTLYAQSPSGGESHPLPAIRGVNLPQR
jgi:prepilin peptidase CpaA